MILQELFDKGEQSSFSFGGEFVIRSPRFLRPDTIILKNKYKEINFVQEYLQTSIKHVKVNDSYGIKQQQRGIESDDNIVIVFDLHDYDAVQSYEKALYVPRNNDLSPGCFTFKNDDIIIFNGKEYTITKVNEAKKDMSGNPVFIEVFAK